jgi:hypothetical protein
MQARNALNSADPRGLLVYWPGGGETCRMPLLVVRARDRLGGADGPAVCQLVSGTFGGGFVLLNDARRDAPAVADRDALAFRPRPDTAAAVAA